LVCTVTVSVVVVVVVGVTLACWPLGPEGPLGAFGIASMISWHGVWYVVHLGAILRSSDTGQVDDPASGRGTSEYSGTC